MDTTKIYDSVIYSDTMNPFETTRHKELERLFKGCIASVSETVGPELASAIEAIRDIAFDLVFSAHKCGTAQGIEIAMSLHEILEHPFEIAEESERGATPISKSEELGLKAIGSYLNITKAGKDETA